MIDEINSEKNVLQKRQSKTVTRNNIVENKLQLTWGNEEYKIFIISDVSIKQITVYKIMVGKYHDC